MPFVKNAWYAAASSEEVDRTLFHRTLLGQDVLLFRRQDGTAVALDNLCPHRFAPLDRGSLVNDTVECGYHGLVFGTDGVCVHNPHGKIPPAAKVRSYPIIERHRLLWIWMGHRAADPDLIADCSFVEITEKSASALGYMYVNANYQLILDNNMDLSHTDFLHKNSFGGNAENEAEVKVVSEGTSVHISRFFSNGAPSATNIGDTNYRGPVDRWQDTWWHPPAILHLDTGSTPVGRPREEGIAHEPWLILTPETETTTHCFYGNARRVDLEDRELDEVRRNHMRAVVEREDNPMIEAQQRFLGERSLLSLKPVILACDAGAIRVRREIEKMIAADQELEPVVLSPG